MSKCLNIVCLQRLYRADGTLVLVYRMLRPSPAYFTLNETCIFLKGLLVQLTQGRNGNCLLQLCQSRLTFAAALIVLGIAQSTLLVAAGYDKLCTLQYNRCIFIGQVSGIQKNGIVLLTHGNGKLIHDTAVDFIELILRKLPNQRQILIGHIKTKEIPEDKSRQYLHGGRGGQPRAVGNVSHQQEVHASGHLHSLLTKGPDDPLRIIGPVRLRRGCQIVQ